MDCRSVNIVMLVLELLNGKPCKPCVARADIEPSEDEIKTIQLDKKLKKHPRVNNMTAVMPGNTTTYPFQ